MAEPEGKVVRVQRDPAKQARESFDVDDILTRLCYFYPQYTLREARLLPYKDVVKLLNQAQKQEALRYYNLTLIANSPNSKKGKIAKDLISNYKKVFEKKWEMAQLNGY